MFNSFGNIFRLTSFGESHGPGVGGVIDGFPAGIDIDMDFVQKELNRRRPVHRVPQDGVADVGQMDPDLVGAARLRWKIHRLSHWFRGMEQEPTF